MFAARAKAVKQAENKRETLEKCRKFSSQSSSSLSLSPRSAYLLSLKASKNEEKDDSSDLENELQESFATYPCIYITRKKIRSIINSQVFESFMFLCIIVTAFMAGIETYPSAKDTVFMKVNI